MKNTRPVAPRQLTWPSEVCAQLPNPPILTSSNALGFLFDAVPRGLDELIRQGRLLPLDELVLKRLLRFRKRLKASCWTSKAVIAEALGVSTRTIQRSLARLSAAGLIEQVQVPTPDPDDPKNRTGWRFDFPWLATSGRDQTEATRRPEQGSYAVGGETAVSSPGETSASSRGETRLSPNLDGIKPDGSLPSSSSKITTDDDESFMIPIEETLEIEPDSPTPPSTDGLAVVEAIHTNLGSTVAAQIEPHAQALVELVNHDVEALTVAAVKAGAIVRRKAIGDVLRYVLVIAMADVLGLPVDQAVTAINAFSKGRRLLPISSEQCCRDLEASRPRKVPVRENYNPPQPREPEPELTSDDIARLEALVANPACHRALRSRAEKELRAIRNLVPA